MLQKARVYPEFEYLPQKFQIDHFHNPYSVKLNIKITPRKTKHPKPYQFVHPLKAHNNLYLSQSLPLYRTQKIRFGLVWRQYMTTRFARSHIGFILQRKIMDNYRLKANLMTGTTSLVNAEFSKTLKNNLQMFVGYSGFFQTSNIYNSISLGLRKGIFSVLLNHKLTDDTEFKMTASKQINSKINIGASINGSFFEPERSELSVGLSQAIDHKSSTSLEVNYNPFYREAGIKVGYERFLSKSQKLLLSSEYTDKSSVIYLGFKNVNFNIVFPVFVTESPIPFLLGVIGFGLAYLYRKKAQKSKNVIEIESDFVEKKEQERQNELKLISEKASDNYEKQKLNPKGLIIDEAYIGPESQIQDFMNNPERFRLLLRDEETKNKFVDLTVSIRFYVCKGQLKLRRGDKSKVLGFYRKDVSHTKIGIRYTREGKNFLHFFNINDAVSIKKQN